MSVGPWKGRAFPLFRGRSRGENVQCSGTNFQLALADAAMNLDECLDQRDGRFPEDLWERKYKVEKC
jgi:hypothetical protein